MFSSKVGYIVLWWRTFVNFEWSFPLQFPKNYKNKLPPILITITPEISPILSKNFVIPWIQAPLKSNSIALLYQVKQCQMLVRHCQLTQLNNKWNNDFIEIKWTLIPVGTIDLEWNNFSLPVAMSRIIIFPSEDPLTKAALSITKVACITNTNFMKLVQAIHAAIFKYPNFS